jgi:hypothetical protein
VQSRWREAPRIKHRFSGQSPAAGTPAAFAIRGTGTPRWQLVKKIPSAFEGPRIGHLADGGQKSVIYWYNITKIRALNVHRINDWSA